MKTKTVCITGLGYVGLLLAEAFSKHLRVIGYDVNAAKIKKLSQNNECNIEFTSDPVMIREADFVIICVPTPVTKSKEPDLSYVKSAAELVGKNLKKGAVVVLESTVYPGVTEETVKPILEEKSGLKCGADFKIGYSPERINPGEEAHTLEKITKIVAGMDKLFCKQKPLLNCLRYFCFAKRNISLVKLSLNPLEKRLQNF
ncbi:MAG: NAD(P)-binding domain-containing protein [Methanophagales archaeon]|nr:NAD(P)-binding domain-containing protein [Methanophagales archaeon]